MPQSAKLTLSVPDEQARYIDRLVRSGRYGSPSEVISAGLTALAAQDETMDEWLRREVVPAYEAIMADPARGISAERVRAALHARHERLIKDERGP